MHVLACYRDSRHDLRGSSNAKEWMEKVPFLTRSRERRHRRPSPVMQASKQNEPTEFQRDDRTQTQEYPP